MPAASFPGPVEAQSYRPLFQKFPGRERQIKTLTTLINPILAPCGNIVVHGTEATGKSTVTAGVLDMIATSSLSVGGGIDSMDDGRLLDTCGRNIDYAIIDSNKCVTVRHLFERTVAKVAEAVNYEPYTNKARPCETLSQLVVELTKMLKYGNHSEGYPENRRFALVFDSIDRQRDAPSTLLPGLARLSEVIPSLTTVFIVTFPPPSMLLTSFVPHVHFANYSKAEFVEILTRTPPTTLAGATPEETAELWMRLCIAVHDSLTRTAGRTLPAFREACMALWPKFTAPVVAGTHGPREFSKLLIASRIYFQDESLLDPGFVVAAPPPASSSSTNERHADSQSAEAQAKDATDPSSAADDNPHAARHLASLLPTAARLFLLCAYLASHNATKHDMTLFSTYYHGRKRKHGGAAGIGTGGRSGARSKHRKIARKLLGAHSFTLERLLAIFAAVRSEWTRAPPVTATGRNSAAAIMDGDCNMAIATLASLRLVLRVSGQASDPIDRAGKWRVNVGWEVVRSLGAQHGY